MRRSLSIAAAVFAHDLKLSFRSGGGWFYALFFFAVFVALAALAVGPELSSLLAAAPAIVWLAAAFALQFAATGIFENDMNDGALRVFAAEQSSLAPYWLGKTCVLAAITAAPIVLAAPFVATMLGAPFRAGLGLAAHLAIGSPALIFIAVLTSALAAGLRAGGLLGMVIAAPFAAPVLVFGVGAAERFFADGVLWPPESLILAALSLFMAALTPGLAVAALRLSLE